MHDAFRLKLLRDTPFGRMPEEAVARVAHLTALREVGAGKILCREGKTGGVFCVVAAGLLKAYRGLASGREITIFLLRPGDSFGF